MTEYQIDVLLFMGIWLVGMVAGGLVANWFETRGEK